MVPLYGYFPWSNRRKVVFPRPFRPVKPSFQLVSI